VRPVSRGIDRIAVTFDEPGLVANAGLFLIATLVKRLDLESATACRAVSLNASCAAANRAVPARQILLRCTAPIASGAERSAERPSATG